MLAASALGMHQQVAAPSTVNAGRPTAQFLRQCGRRRAFRHHFQIRRTLADQLQRLRHLARLLDLCEPKLDWTNRAISAARKRLTSSAANKVISADLLGRSVRIDVGVAEEQRSTRDLISIFMAAGSALLPQTDDVQQYSIVIG